MDNKTKKIVALVMLSLSISNLWLIKKHENMLTEISNSKYEIARLEIQNKELNQSILENKGAIEEALDTIKQNEKLVKENEILKKYKDDNRNFSLSRGGGDRHLKVKKIKVELSMYCNDPISATGIVPRWGVVAAPPEIPFGSSLIIEGVEGIENEVFLVADRGGYIKKVEDTYRIDIYTENDRDYAMEFGRIKDVEAYLIMGE